MRIAVVGAGAIGGIVAFYLAKAGKDPLVVARPETAAVLASRGITLAGPAGEMTTPVRTTSDAAAAGVQDLVFVGFKAHDWLTALGSVTPLIGPGTIVVPMLNGIPWWYLDGLGSGFGEARLISVDPAGEIAAGVPTATVLGCVVYVGASRSAPDRIVWNGRKRLILGEPAGPVSDRLDMVASLLRESEIDAETTPDIRGAIWTKLLGNAAFNPISSLTGATMDEMIDDGNVRQVARTIMTECVAVAQALGVTEPLDVAARLITHPMMVGIKTSMLQDREAGRPLELGAVVDAIAELGRRTGIATPMIEAISALAANSWRHAWPAKS